MNYGDLLKKAQELKEQGKEWNEARNELIRYALSSREYRVYRAGNPAAFGKTINDTLKTVGIKDIRYAGTANTLANILGF